MIGLFAYVPAELLQDVSTSPLWWRRFLKCKETERGKMGETGEDYRKRESITKERRNCDKPWLSSGTSSGIASALSTQKWHCPSFRFQQRAGVLHAPPCPTPSPHTHTPGMDVALILPSQLDSFLFSLPPRTLTSSLYSRKLYVFCYHVLLG